MSRRWIIANLTATCDERIDGERRCGAHYSIPTVPDAEVAPPTRPSAPINAADVIRLTARDDGLLPRVLLVVARLGRQHREQLNSTLRSRKPKQIGEFAAVILLTTHSD